MFAICIYIFTNFVTVSSCHCPPSKQCFPSVRQGYHQQNNFTWSQQPQQLQTSYCLHQVHSQPQFYGNVNQIDKNDTIQNSLSFASNTPRSLPTVRMTPGFNVVTSAHLLPHTLQDSVPTVGQPSTTTAPTSQHSSPTVKPTKLLEIFQQYYPNLVKLLPMNDDTFIAELYKNHLLPDNIKANIKSLPTPIQKATEFLDNIIKPSVECEDDTCLNALLTTMRGSSNIMVRKLAETISSKVLSQQLSDSKTSMLIISISYV